MPRIVALEQVFADSVTLGPKPRVYTWRPRAPEFPCVWNWLMDIPNQQVDNARQRDDLMLVAVVALHHTDDQEEMDRMTHYMDKFRAAIDPALYVKAPLGAKEAQRIGMRTAEQSFGATSVLSVEFPIRLRLDRTFTP